MPSSLIANRAAAILMELEGRILTPPQTMQRHITVFRRLQTAGLMIIMTMAILSTTVRRLLLLVGCLNGKAGITPSYGEVCTCIDVYSRHNYQGFALVGNVGATGHISGRNGSSLICYGCISDANTRGSQKKGFVVMGTGNSATFVNCVAMNETRGFCALGDVYMKLIDCRVVSCGTDKYTEGSSTVEIVNGTAITV